MKVTYNNDYAKPVTLDEIHGSYPYKLYLEVIGTNVFGKYIVIVSEDEIEIENPDKVQLEIDRSTIRLLGNNTFSGKKVNPVKIRRENESMRVFVQVWYGKANR